MYPIHYGTLLMAEYYHPIYLSLPLDHLKTPRHVRDLIRDSEQHLVTKSHNSYNTISSSNVKRADYGFENYVDMTETPLRSITNRGTGITILAPTYSTKIFIDCTVMTTYAIPFVHRYVTCPRFDRRYLHT